MPHESQHDKAELSPAELHFRLIEQYAPPSVIINSDQEIVHLSQKAGKFLQWAGGQPTPNLLSVVHPMLRPDLRSALFRAAETDSTVELRKLHFAVEGSPRVVNISVSPARELAPGFLLVVFESMEVESEVADEARIAPEPAMGLRELTEGAKANEALRASEEQFRRAIEDAPIPVIMHAEDGQVLQISSTWTELTGFTPQDIPTFDAWLNKAYGEGADKVRAHIRHLFSEHTGQMEEEIEIKAKSGESRLWSVSTSAPGKLHDGRRFVVAMALDITDRRKVEMALEKALAHAETLRREADAANKAKDHFLATLSHELRTPLMPVLLTAESLLKNRDLPERVRQGLQMISRNVQLETHFINDLLDLTRISKGKFDLLREPVELHEAINGALEICDAEFKARNQKLSLSLEAKRTEMIGDSARLQQVFWNLLKNASKFTPENGKIQVSSQNEGNNIVVKIQDSGIGIDPAHLKDVFEAFRQGDASVSREYGGLGLGLAISKATVEQLNGSIEAESAGRGHGAVLTVKLPLRSRSPENK